MSNTPQHDRNKKVENVAFNFTVWVSIAAVVIVGIVTILYYRGGV